MMIIKRLVKPLVGCISPFRSALLTIGSIHPFTMMSLFEQPKKAHELSPMFKK